MVSHTLLGAKNLRKWKPTQKLQPHGVLGPQTGCGVAGAAEGGPVLRQHLSQLSASYQARCPELRVGPRVAALGFS